MEKHANKWPHVRGIQFPFHPVGFLALVIIRAKILLQEMWAAGMDWDDLFLGDLASKARKWFKELEDLPTIKVP